MVGGFRESDRRRLCKIQSMHFLSPTSFSDMRERVSERDSANEKHEDIHGKEIFLVSRLAPQEANAKLKKSSKRGPFPNL